MHCLVTGASGFVGRHLVPKLRDSGHRVTILRRGGSAASGAEWPGPSKLGDVETWPDWPKDVDAVVHLAAANPARGESAASDEAYLREANVDATAALARRSAREDVRRFVFLSSANVHAPRPAGGVIGENDPLGPQSPYARSKVLAEDALRVALDDTGTTYCILRPAPVFGHGGRGTVASLAKLAASPWPLPLKGLGGARSLVAVDDLTAAIALALNVPDASCETLLVSGGSATAADIVAALRRGAGRHPRLIPAPIKLSSMLARTLGKGPIWDGLMRDFVLDPGRAERLLGWAPERPVHARLEEMGR